MISTNNYICFVIIKTPKPGDCNLGPTLFMYAQYYQGFLYLQYSGLFLEKQYACSIGNPTTDSLSRTTHAMQGFILYYGLQHYGFIGISSALFHNLKEVLLLCHQVNSLYIIQNGQSSEILAVFFYQLISGQYYQAPSEDIYGRNAVMSKS